MLSGKRGFYTDKAAPAALVGGEAHPYYVRTAAPDDFLRAHTAETWENGAVVTGAVDVCEMLAWAKAQRDKDPAVFIAGMLGAYIDEFDSQTGEVIATKKTPLTNKEIHKYARRRNPFNNQTLVYKKSRALSVGGYSNIKRCEDYEFVVKMLADGARGINLDKTLVMYRVTANNYERRRNWANTKSFVNVRWKIFRMGYSNLWDFIVPCTFQFFIFIMPKSLTGKIYKRFLRG